MHKKLIIGLVAAIVATASTGGLYYRHYSSQQNCVSYYDKTGTELLYKDCQ